MKNLLITTDNDKHSKLIEDLLNGLSFIKSIHVIDDIEAASLSKIKDQKIRLDIPRGVKVSLEFKKQ